MTYEFRRIDFPEMEIVTNRRGKTIATSRLSPAHLDFRVRDAEFSADLTSEETDELMALLGRVADRTVRQFAGACPREVAT